VITKITLQNGVYVIESERAIMSEIFEDIDFSMDIVYDSRFMDENATAVASTSGMGRVLADGIELDFKGYTHSSNNDNKYGFKVSWNDKTLGLKGEVDVRLKVSVKFNRSEGFTFALTNTLDFNMDGKLALDLLAGITESGVFKPIVLPHIAGVIPWGISVTPKLNVGFDFGRETGAAVSSTITSNIRDGKFTGSHTLGGSMTVAEIDRTTAKFSASFPVELYLYLGSEDIGVNDSDISSGMAFTPELALTAKLAPEISLYGQLKEKLTLRWLNLNLPKCFFNIGVGIGGESSFSYNSPEVKIWGVTPSTDSETVARIISDLRNIRSAALQYYADNTAWPDTGNTFDLIAPYLGISHFDPKLYTGNTIDVKTIAAPPTRYLYGVQLAGALTQGVLDKLGDSGIVVNADGTAFSGGVSSWAYIIVLG
jgi:hypothetical protein